MNLKNGISFFVGIIFALGLGLSGMTQPKKVIGFLDIFGSWDPSLVMVMLGAILFHGVAYYWVIQRKKPVLDNKFQVPQTTIIDWKLIVGSALFGMGWGLGGYCPGPSLTSLVTLKMEPLIFVSMMLVGMAVFHFSKPWLGIQK